MFSFNVFHNSVGEAEQTSSRAHHWTLWSQVYRRQLRLACSVWGGCKESDFFLIGSPHLRKRSYACGGRYAGHLGGQDSHRRSETSRGTRIESFAPTTYGCVRTKLDAPSQHASHWLSPQLAMSQKTVRCAG